MRRIIDLLIQLLCRKPIGTGDDPDAVAMYETEPDAFERAVDLILKHEGGYVDHASDPGGRTNFGISQRAYPDLNIKELTRYEAIDIYRSDYWLCCQCDKMPGGIGLSVFDFAVNAGNARAIRTLQYVLGVAVDGVIGPKTLAAAQDADTVEVYAYADQRMIFYKGLTTFSTFGRGWTRRTEETLTEALKLCE